MHVQYSHRGPITYRNEKWFSGLAWKSINVNNVKKVKIAKEETTEIKKSRQQKLTRQACSEYTLFILRLTFKRGAPYSGRPVWCHCGFRAKTSRFSAGQQVCQQNPHYFQTHCCYHSNCSGWSTEIFEDPPFPALRVTRLLHFRGIKFLLINLCP